MADHREGVCSPESIRVLQLLDQTGPMTRVAIDREMERWDPGEAIAYLENYGIIVGARHPSTGKPMPGAWATTDVGRGIMQTELTYALTRIRELRAEAQRWVENPKASDEDRAASTSETERWTALEAALKGHKPSRKFNAGQPIAPPPVVPVESDDDDDDGEAAGAAKQPKRRGAAKQPKRRGAA